MTKPPPLPAQGGSYTRLEDGTLVPADQAPPPATLEKPPAKSAKKEG